MAGHQSSSVTEEASRPRVTSDLRPPHQQQRPDHNPLSHPTSPVSLSPHDDQHIIASAESRDAWIFNDEELQQTPSRLSGITKEIERTYQLLCIDHIEHLARVNGVPPGMVPSLAVILLQRYLMLEDLSQIMAPDVLPAGALFLACKLSECPKRVHDVVVSSYMLRSIRDPDLDKSRKIEDVMDAIDSQRSYELPRDVMTNIQFGGSPPPEGSPLFTKGTLTMSVFRREKDALLFHEQNILRTLAFNLDLEVAHMYTMRLIKRFVPEHHHRAMVQNMFYFLNDSVRTYILLQYDQKEIASACFALAAWLDNVKLSPVRMNPKEFEMHRNIIGKEEAKPISLNQSDDVKAGKKLQTDHAMLSASDDEDLREMKWYEVLHCEIARIEAVMDLIMDTYDPSLNASSTNV